MTVNIGASAFADRACALRAEPAAQSQAEPLVPSATFCPVQDPREPSRRQHERDMATGSRIMIAALWTAHPLILRKLTGRMGP
jgi:hypothetical protein